MNLDTNYKNWITSLKDKIRSAQLKAAFSVNEQMILLYWEIGKSVVEAQATQQWGNKVIEQMAKDLKLELPEVSGFSQSNLYVMRRFYLFYKDSKLVRQAGSQLQDNDFQLDIILQQAAVKLNNELAQQTAGLITKQNILCKIPWWHHQVILTKCKNEVEATFYIQQTIQNNWSRNVLEIQISSGLVNRLGKSQNNFEFTLPKLQSDLAIETLKNPYSFDFLTLEADVQELELEKQLTKNITKFLLELGKGFAFVGRQYPMQIGNKERKLDLLFYHLIMHCYVVIDLKMGEFEPEYAGKMNYYLSAVDDLLKTDIDKPSIGIILCKSKDSLEVEYALRDLDKPLGISEFTFNELPESIQKNMPTVEELENELKNTP